MIELLNRLAKEILQVCHVDRGIQQLPPFEGRCIVDDQYALLLNRQSDDNIQYVGVHLKLLLHTSTKVG